MYLKFSDILLAAHFVISQQAHIVVIFGTVLDVEVAILQVDDLEGEHIGDEPRHHYEQFVFSDDSMKW